MCPNRSKALHTPLSPHPHFPIRCNVILEDQDNSDDPPKLLQESDASAFPERRSLQACGWQRVSGQRL
jgi:hypothetical protein